MKELNEGSQTLFQCEECELKYLEKEWARKCEAWCKEYRSCNLDIIAHAQKSTD